MRTIVTLFFRLVLRVFYRRIEIVGEESVPQKGPVMLVLNHPNGLLDPGLVLCFASRPVSFLGKSTLFKMPVVSWIMKAFESIPVYRKADAGENTDNNKKTFTLSRELLQRGSILALFPEGVSHSDTQLKPLKTGAARIAIGASTEEAPVQLVPAGLYFPDKGIFRSDALLVYGTPIIASAAELDEEGEPPREVARALTDQIKEGLDAVMLQAEHNEAMAMVDWAEELLSEGESTLAEEFSLKQQLMEGWTTLKDKVPERLATLEANMRLLEGKFALVGLQPQLLSPELFTPATVARYAIKHIIQLLVFCPIALVGVVLNGLQYKLVDVIARQKGQEGEDILATVKVLASMLFYPVVWLLWGALVWWQLSFYWAVGVVLLGPITGMGALFFFGRFGRAWTALFHLRTFLTGRQIFDSMHEEQEIIRKEIIALGALLEESK